ncbi:MAG: NAD(P)-dependent oxidoreductase [Chitinophagaceae bacterium]|nr:NAD(P)-dependent oxidoreductase [Chitinophagaceae bacterium]MCW5929617.1 NAD(P)-dependent oxidoreductase [Chitinophagaceae bacterium]
MKILVTGASGFIGGRITEAFAAEAGVQVIATGRSYTGRFGNYPNVTYFQQDLSRPMPSQYCDVCIHCAGLADDRSTKAEFTRHNVEATENLLSALRGCETLVFISSASVYDFADGKTKSEDDADINSRLSMYGKTKLLAERVVAGPGITSVYILRPRAVYGPGDRVLLPRILRLIKGNKMILPGTLSSKTSLTHIQNLCEAVLASAAQSKPGVHVFNITDQKVYDLRSVFGEIAFKKTGKRAFIRIPDMIVRIIASAGAVPGLKSQLSTQSLNYITQNAVLMTGKAVKELDYQGNHEFYSSIDQLDI